jgi:tRNA1Val (adenine37-N6)-methyltransferase
VSAPTREQPAPGLVVYQPRRGFRYAMDPFLLSAWSLEGGRPRTVVDIGTGSGIMALLLARLGVAVQGFDVRPEWIELASRSARESGLDVSFTCVDVRTLPPSNPPADLAVINPPYLRSGQGRPSPDPWKAAARTELNGGLEELLRAGALLAERLCLVLRADRGDEAELALAAVGLHPRRRCDIDTSLVLLEGRPEPGALRRERVCMRNPDGAWAPRVRGWYASLGARLS